MPNKDFDGSKTAGKCRIFQAPYYFITMMQDVRVKLNPELP